MTTCESQGKRNDAHAPPKLLLDEHVWQGPAGAFADTSYDITT